MINSKTTKYDLIAQLHLKFYLNTVQILNCHDNKKTNKCDYKIQMVWDRQWMLQNAEDKFIHWPVW